MISMNGKVHQLNIGSGGVPKYPVESIKVKTERVEGDDWDWSVYKIQKNGKLGGHGGPDQAVCLFSLESYQGLAGQGFRVRKDTPKIHFHLRIGDVPRPGDLGENITTIGLDYKKIRVGDIYQVGEVSLEITKPREPCGTVFKVFGENLGKEIFDDLVRHGDYQSDKWGKSGFYARVIREGVVNQFDEILRISEGSILYVPSSVDKI